MNDFTSQMLSFLSDSKAKTSYKMGIVCKEEGLYENEARDKSGVNHKTKYFYVMYQVLI